MEARMLAVADVVAAMASHRPYCPALGLDKAIWEISAKHHEPVTRSKIIGEVKYNI